MPAKTYETLQVEIAEDGVTTLTLNRPEQLNAFTVTMAHELEDFFRAASLDDDIRIIVVTGSGRAFCAGMDLKAREGNVFGLNDKLRPTLQDMRDRFHDPEIAEGVRDTGGRVTLAIHDCTKPVIGALNGDAVGIGATMTLAMDIRLASANTRIGFVFARLGIVPEACSSWFLPRIVGQQTAMEWMLTGDILDAETAKAGGLFRSVHADRDALLAEAYGLARKIVHNRSASAIAITRQMMRRNAALPSPRDAHLVDSLGMFYSSIGDGMEGVAAFLGKRAPAFKDKASELPKAFYPWWDEK